MLWAQMFGKWRLGTCDNVWHHFFDLKIKANKRSKICHSPDYKNETATQLWSSAWILSLPERVFSSEGQLFLVLEHIFCEKVYHLVAQSRPLCDPMDCSLPGFSRQEYWSGLPCPPSGDLTKPGIEPRYSALQVHSLPSEPPGKPMNTTVGSLSLLQGNFLTQA